MKRPTATRFSTMCATRTGAGSSDGTGRSLEDRLGEPLDVIEAQFRRFLTDGESTPPLRMVPAGLASNPPGLTRQHKGSVP